MHVSSSEIQWFAFLCLRKLQWKVGREQHHFLGANFHSTSKLSESRGSQAFPQCLQLQSKPSCITCSHSSLRGGTKTAMQLTHSKWLKGGIFIACFSEGCVLSKSGCRVGYFHVMTCHDKTYKCHSGQIYPVSVRSRK